MRPKYLENYHNKLFSRRAFRDVNQKSIEQIAKASIRKLLISSKDIRFGRIEYRDHSQTRS